jgi:AcrR family transcriptional regulator
MSDMSVEERQLRADAKRNRQRLIESAQTLFRQRGLDVSVAEIAEAAGVGRGTLFRNFASKEDLIGAIIAERMNDAAAYGEQLVDADDPGEALFEFLRDLVGRQQLDRALFEALDETWMSKDVLRPAHARIMGVLGQLLENAQDAGVVRRDVGAMDVLLMFKGACLAAASYAQIDPTIIDRHLDLIRASIAAVPGTPPLRGRTPTLEDLGIS